MLRTALLTPARALETSMGTRGMATLQEISMRLASVQNIQKITKSMKMVSAAKFARAETALKASRAIGIAGDAMTDKVGCGQEQGEKSLIVSISSDRGLCGGVHSLLAKRIRLNLADTPSTVETKIVCVGDRQRGIISRTHADDIILSVADIGKNPATFLEASLIAEETVNTGYEFETADIYYNHFKSAMAFEQRSKRIAGASSLAVENESLSIYDDLDEQVLKDYAHFNLATNIYYGLLEGAASEQSARMSAMENATNNASEMIDGLQLTYNRTRQAVITRELIEIISGAAALD